MSSSRVVLPLALLAATAGCSRPWVTDKPEVQARYELRYHGQCNAWAKSAKTGYKYCASPPFEADVKTVTVGAAAAPSAASVSMKDGPTDVASLQAHGEKVYGAICVSCHQADGKGLSGSFPPLAGSGAFYGDAKNHAKIVVHGLNGPIEVQGQAFNSSMPPQGAALTDYDIASVLTYERSSWGNNDGAVLPADVAAVR